MFIGFCHWHGFTGSFVHITTLSPQVLTLSTSLYALFNCVLRPLVLPLVLGTHTATQHGQVASCISIICPCHLDVLQVICHCIASALPGTSSCSLAIFCWEPCHHQLCNNYYMYLFILTAGLVYFCDYRVSCGECIVRQ